MGHVGKDYFKNPDKLPINTLFLDHKTVIKTHKRPSSSINDVLKELDDRHVQAKWKDKYETKTEKKPAIDKCWLLPNENYPLFRRYYHQFTIEENSSFLELNEEHLVSLLCLLNCTYHEFWCRIVCEPQVGYTILYFLENAISPFTVSFLNEEFLGLYTKVYSSIFKIYERLFVFKISEYEYMSEETALKYLRTTNLLNIRSILLLCYLYNDTQPQFVRRILEFYFSKLSEDDCNREIKNLLRDIMEKFEVMECGPGQSLRFSPKKVASVGLSNALSKLKQFDPSWLEESSFYVLEMMASLRELFSVCKTAVRIGIELEFPQRLGHAFQKIYTNFYTMIENEQDVSFDWSHLEELINKWLPFGRRQFVDVFSEFTSYYIEKIVGLRRSEVEQHRWLDEYMDLISVILEEHAFIKDYHKIQPLDAHFKVLIDNVSDFDKTQADYYLQSLTKIPPEDQLDYRIMRKRRNKSIIAPKKQQSKNSFKLVSRHQYEEVLQILTDYSELKEFSNTNSEIPSRVVAAIKIFSRWRRLWKENPAQWSFEPVTNYAEKTELEHLLQNGSNVTKPSQEVIERSIQTILSTFPDLGAEFISKCLERMNYCTEEVVAMILDNNLPPDLVDVPRDLSRGGSSSFDMPGSSSQGVVKPQPPKLIGYKGKKPSYSDANQMLNDKKAKEDIRDFVLSKSLVYDLDDDYDDRLEATQIAHPLQEFDENKIYRHMKKANIPELFDEQEDSSSDSISEEQSQPKDAFCEDPALIRARREAQRARSDQQRTQNHKQKEWYRNKKESKSEKPKNGEVDRKNEKSVHDDRNKKGVHKSSRANHSRKGGAQWKRNKGMIPS